MSLMFRTLFAFVAEEAGELSVGKGELLRTVQEEDDGDSTDGWIQVQNGQGEKGVVPRDYVELLPTPQTPPSPSPSPSEGEAEAEAEAEGSCLDSPLSPPVLQHVSSEIAADVSQLGYGNWLLPADASQSQSQSQSPLAALHREPSPSPSGGGGRPSAGTSLPYPGNKSGSFSRSAETPGGMTLYDLAADLPPSPLSPEPLPRRAGGGAGVFASFRTDAVPRDAREPARVFSANSFVKMTGFPAPAPAPAGVLAGGRSSPAAHGAPLPPLPYGAAAGDPSPPPFSLGGSTEPVFSPAAVRGDWDELLRRLSAHFASETEQAEADATALLAAADGLAERLRGAAAADSGLLDGLRELSDGLEEERAAQLAALKAMRNSLALRQDGDGEFE